MSADHRSGMPIADAAKHLGVSVEMLRKRAQRGTLPSYKVDGRWFIVVDEPDETTAVQDETTVQDVQDRTGRTGQSESNPSPPAPVSAAALSQLDAIRDQWLRPFVEDLNAKSERIGQLQERLATTEQRLAAAEQERDELRRLMEEALLFDPDNDDAAMADTAKSAPIPESPQTHTMAPGRADPPDVSNESNTGAASAGRSVFEDLWRWIRGR